MNEASSNNNQGIELGKIGEPSSLELVEDAAAKKEAAGAAAGTLEEQTLALTQSLRRHINWAVLLLVWLSALLIAIALAVAAFHHLTPWGWLTESQLAVLDTFLFSGALVSTVGRYISTRIFNN